MNVARRGGLAILSLLLLGSVAARTPTALILRLATPDSEASPASRLLKVWAQAVSNKSDGMLEISITYGQDESALVDRMSGTDRSFDGARLSGIGLQRISKDFVAMEMPGMFATVAQFDQVREPLKGGFQKEFEERGFTFVHWAGESLKRLASKRVPLGAPGNLKSRKFLVPPGDAIAALLAKELQAITTAADRAGASVKLVSGDVEVLLATASSIQELQWIDTLDSTLEEPVGFEVSVLVFSSKSLEALSPDLKTILLDTGRVTGNALMRRMRVDDQAASSRLKSKLQAPALSDDEKAQWRLVWSGVRKRAIEDKVCSADIIAKLEAATK